MAATYGAVGFVVLQVTDLIADGLQLPPVVRTTITVLVLVGFPIALALAWALERGPGGEVQRTPDAGDGELEEIATESRARRWPAGLAAVAGTVLLVFGGWYALDRIGGDAEAGRDAAPASSETTAPRPALTPGSTSGTGLVVMPFAVQGGPDVEYLGDGMVSLLGTKLDGAGDLQTVDARAVLLAMERDGLAAGDPEAGARAAADFGARFHVVDLSSEEYVHVLKAAHSLRQCPRQGRCDRIKDLDCGPPTYKVVFQPLPQAPKHFRVRFTEASAIAESRPSLLLAGAIRHGLHDSSSSSELLRSMK